MNCNKQDKEKRKTQLISHLPTKYSKAKNDIVKKICAVDDKTLFSKEFELKIIHESIPIHTENYLLKTNLNALFEGNNLNEVNQFLLVLNWYSNQSSNYLESF